ncbi:MAG: hypothetical protein Ct9H300mP17_13170 [Candidatus Nitrosopelagicus sp.]|nr:MAG: hypothetical protein Ct9H300mP17_13170 [Candidatus Nitrosopelagicus sp.]
MVTVNLVGGARKSFQTDSLEITQSIEDISELFFPSYFKKT